MPDLNKAINPFYFCTRLILRELTGIRARNIKELLKYIKTVSGSVIYNHTHQFLQQHIHLSPEPPNDFAYWVKGFLNEEELAEKMMSIDTCGFCTIRELRNAIVKTIQDHLAKAKGPLRIAPKGSEFYFVKAMSFVLPTPHVADDLKGFIECIKKISVYSIYFHMFESKLRLEKGTNDFSFWLGTSLGKAELAEEIARLDPYTYTIEELRSELIKRAEKYLK
ncbi:MAG: hypothetical protein HQ575_00040 [Candidatus Omnitrophica bacterium]|nr:hypothetical protein [Candidatus Omnitrophota bacterium]